MLSSINIYTQTFLEALAKKMELFSSQALLISPKSELKKETACMFILLRADFYRICAVTHLYSGSDKWKNTPAAWEEKLSPSFQKSGKSG